MFDKAPDSRTAEVRFEVALDASQLPVSIVWSATDAPDQALRSTRSVMLSVWNSDEQKAMAIDLWTREMRVDEMKLFVYQTLLTMADTLERATAEGAAADDLRRFAARLAGTMGLSR